MTKKFCDRCMKDITKLSYRLRIDGYKDVEICKECRVSVRLWLGMGTSPTPDYPSDRPVPGKSTPEMLG